VVRNSGRSRTHGEQRLTWTGQIDDEVIVEYRGNECRPQTVRGRPVQADRFSFSRPLPHESLPDLAVKKLRGRGRVDIVEFPSSPNGWRLVFQVNDDSGGADDYEVEVSW
jgi:hypothetical protein